MTPEGAVATGERARAWSDLVVSGPVSGLFELKDVERLDVDAVRLSDGYEYRYHRGGRFTWFSKNTGEEMPVRSAQGLPHRAWLHLPGCACAACAPK